MRKRYNSHTNPTHSHVSLRILIFTIICIITLLSQFCANSSALYAGADAAVINFTPFYAGAAAVGDMPFVENIPLDKSDYTNGEIIVNGAPIDAPRPSVTHGVIMLPLRPIAEALGYTVAWDDAEQRVAICADINYGNAVGSGDGVSAADVINYVLWIGRPAFSADGGLTTREFGPAPELIDDRTYVPISMFNFGFAGLNAKIDADGKVLIVTIHR